MSLFEVLSAGLKLLAEQEDLVGQLRCEFARIDGTVHLLDQVQDLLLKLRILHANLKSLATLVHFRRSPLHFSTLNQSERTQKQRSRSMAALLSAALRELICVTFKNCVK